MAAPSVKRAPSSDPSWRLRLLGIVLIPLVIFPVLALVSYDCTDVPFIQTPPNETTRNLIGPVGASLTWVGYFLFGLASWLLPVWMLVFGILFAAGKTQRLPRRLVCAGLILLSACGLVQELGAKGRILETVANAQTPLGLGGNAGGILGHFIMDLMLDRALGRIGGPLVALAILVASLAFFIGFGTLGRLFGSLRERWNDARLRRLDEGEQERIREERRRRDEAKAEKRRLQEEKRAERERVREEKRAEKERRREEREERDNRRRAEIEADKERRAAEELARSEAAAEEDDDEGGRLPRSAATRTRPAGGAGAAGDEADPSPPLPYELPPLDLLPPAPATEAVYGDVEKKQRTLVETLQEFRLDVEVTNIERGPVLTTFELLPASGIRPEQIAAMAKTIEMRLHATGIRIEAPIPGKGVIGVEIPNEKASPVTVREILEGSTWKEAEKKMFLPMLLGKNASGHDIVFDLASIPHLLIAGATGSGKSVCINAILTGLLMSRTPDQVRLILVDPKVVEFADYNAIPHLLVPIISDPKKVSLGLVWAIREMDRRYRELARAGVKNIASYNARAMQVQQDFFDTDTLRKPEKMPYIVIVIDELADIMLQVGREVDDSIARLAAKARAVGIHLILATQRPSVNVVTGTIKANIAGRIAFQVASQVDSKTILDGKGAESLIGHGDMLFLNPRASKILRAQGAYISDKDAEAVTDFIRRQGPPRYLQEVQDQLDAADEGDGDASRQSRRNGFGGGFPSAAGPWGDSGGGAAPPDTEDDADEILYQKALQIVRETHRASTSSIQRRLRIGYTRAARLVDLMEERGIVGPPRGSDPREILVDLDGEVPNNAAMGSDDDDDENG